MNWGEPVDPRKTNDFEECVLTVQKQELGRLGENLAADHLQQRGHVIIARNWRCAVGEIDIVAREDDTIAFVEVRTRRGNRFGTPEESITQAKRDKLLELAQTYLQEHELADADWRIDVVAIEMERHGGVKRLNLIRHAVSV